MWFEHWTRHDFDKSLKIDTYQFCVTICAIVHRREASPFKKVKDATVNFIKSISIQGIKLPNSYFRTLKQLYI